MCPLRNIGTAIVFLVAVDAASLCAWTSDDATKQWPSGWRDGLRSLHDLLRCEGYNKAARPLPGTIAELLQALEMEDDGTDAGIDRPTGAQRQQRRGFGAPQRSHGALGGSRTGEASHWRLAGR